MSFSAQIKNMKDIPIDDHVARWTGGDSIKDGIVSASAFDFKFKKDENGNLKSIYPRIGLNIFLVFRMKRIGFLKFTK